MWDVADDLVSSLSLVEIDDESKSICIWGENPGRYGTVKGMPAMERGAGGRRRSAWSAQEAGIPAVVLRNLLASVIKPALAHFYEKTLYSPPTQPDPPNFLDTMLSKDLFSCVERAAAE